MFSISSVLVDPVQRQAILRFRRGMRVEKVARSKFPPKLEPRRLGDNRRASFNLVTDREDWWFCVCCASWRGTGFEVVWHAARLMSIQDPEEGLGMKRR